jgi:ankyrin repeat protein
MRFLKSISITGIVILLSTMSLFSFASDVKFKANATKLVKTGDLTKLKNLFISQPSIRNIPSSSMDIRFITELLLAAAESQHADLEVVRFLVENGADPDAEAILMNGLKLTPLKKAIQGVNMYVTNSYLSEAMQKINKSSQVSGLNKRMDIIQYLVSNGANCESYSVIAPAINVNVKIYEQLVQMDCPPNPKNIDSGKTVLDTYQEAAKQLQHQLNVIK